MERTASYVARNFLMNISWILKQGCYFLYVTFAEKGKEINIGVFTLWVVLSVENKELLQQSSIDTRHSTRSRQNKQQKQDTVVIKNNKRSNNYQVNPTPQSEYLSTPIQSCVGMQLPSNNKSHCSPVQGNLIVIPPHISQYIISNRHNPSAIRSYIGEYYWKALCSPN